MTMPQLNMLSSSALSQNPSLSIRNSSLPLLFSGSSHLGNSVRLTRVSAAPMSYRKFVLQCRQSEYYDQKQWSSSQPPSENSSFGASGGGVAGGGGTVSSKLYVSHSIYKGKAALTVEPKAPEFTSLDSGATKLSREGFVLLQFAPAAGTRVYDWSKKQVFSLSVTEIGTLIGMSGKDSCEFFHDPFKGKSDEGKVRKVLKVEPLPDGSGHFFNLTVQNKMLNMDESIYIPVTKAEFTVLNSAFSFILPHLLGWSAFANSIKVEDAQRSNNANPRYGGDFEWSRQ